MEEQLKNRKSKILKRVIVLLVIIFVLIFIGFKIITIPEGNIEYYMQMIGIDKDITIEIRDVTPTPTGYASSYYNYYIDLDDKKIYKVSVYNVWGVTSRLGEKGEHYELEREKELTDKEIDNIIMLAEGKVIEESVYNDDYMFDNYEYTIKYNKKETIIINSTILGDIIDSM